MARARLSTELCADATLINSARYGHSAWVCRDRWAYLLEHLDRPGPERRGNRYRSCLHSDATAERMTSCPASGIYSYAAGSMRRKSLEELASQRRNGFRHQTAPLRADGRARAVARVLSMELRWPVCDPRGCGCLTSIFAAVDLLRGRGLNTIQYHAVWSPGVGRYSQEAAASGAGRKPLQRRCRRGTIRE